MDPLAEMHLLLREHGWEPDWNGDEFWWRWSKEGRGIFFGTCKGIDEGTAVCVEGNWPTARHFSDIFDQDSNYHDLDSLRRRPKELAAPQAPS